MSEEEPKTPGSAAVRSMLRKRSEDPSQQSAAHIFGEMRHNPEQVRALFREGRYP